MANTQEITAKTPMMCKSAHCAGQLKHPKSPWESHFGRVPSIVYCGVPRNNSHLRLSLFGFRNREKSQVGELRSGEVRGPVISAANFKVKVELGL